MSDTASSSPTSRTPEPGDRHAPAGPVFGPPNRAGLGMGILSILLGVLVLVLPGITLLVVAVLFGIELVALGALRIALGAALPRGTGWVKPASIALGILTVLAGIFCFVRPGASLIVLAIFLAAGWIAEGIGSLVHAIRPGRSTGGVVYLLVSGLVSIVAGIVVAVFPVATLILLAQVAGFLLIVVGAAQLVSAIGHRRAGPARAA